MNIYVGNLSYETTEDELREAFGAFGQVDAARIIVDRMTNRSRGFGFVEMPERTEALEAIDKMDGADLGGRTLRVNEARPREQRGPNRDYRPRYE
ncbi:MAG TPA: RNA-binding protein [Candidatus Hydrogenedentes bacterium]|nr:RNA-binding protein [Candidatus Hydrogenedentota bacterium]